MCKRIVVLLAFVLVLLTGCQGGNHLMQSKPAVHTPEGTEVTLKILAEDSQTFYQSRMGKILEIVMERFTAEYPNVTFEIEYLPNEKSKIEEREMRIEQLRYEILAGEGPDIYLLSAPSSTEFGGYEWVSQNEPVFTDVNVAIRNGVFHDLSAYYNADEELHTEELKQEVMDAGTYGEARYILPLSYDMKVIHVSEEIAQEYGVTAEAFSASAQSAQNAVADIMEKFPEPGIDSLLGEDAMLGLCIFGQILDYDKGKVLLEEQALADWIRNAYEIQKTELSLSAGATEFHFSYQRTLLETYFGMIGMSDSWYQAKNPAYIEEIENAFEYAIIDKIEPGEYDTYPLRSSDGTVTAKVNWWGAVGAGCDCADVAYDFLREFLTREVQWDLERSEVASKSAHPFCWDGIPVRTEGLVEPMLERYKPFIDELARMAGRDDREELAVMKMTDEDFPILDVKIDNVIFDSVHERTYRQMTGDWYDFKTKSYKELDFDQMAADYIRDLEFFLAES